MWQRLSRDDFQEAGGQMGGGAGTRQWHVCEAYALKIPADTQEGDVDSYLVVPEHRREPGYFDRWRSYEPLEDTPDLFLRFARLHGAKDPTEAMVEWASSYGTLGHGQPRWVPSAPQDAKGFREAAGEAAGVLALYEAVLNGDEDRARSIVLHDFPYVGLWWRAFNSMSKADEPHDHEWVAKHISESVEEIYEGDYLAYALDVAVEEVNTKVSFLCRQRLGVETGARTPSSVKTEWYFKSLLGAMYLQMYWLMAAGADLVRCENCGRIVSHARSRPGGRKSRRDKRFCDNACRQAHHRSKKSGLAGKP